MGFMDKAKQLADQAQQKIDETQTKLTEAQRQRAEQESAAGEATPGDVEAGTHPPAAPDTEAEAPPAADPSPSGGSADRPNATPDPFKPIE